MRKLIIFLTFANSIFALPHFSIRTASNCQSCHINPTGKGMRNFSGINFSQNELPFESLTETDNFEKINPKLNENISIGFDSRVLFYSDVANKSSLFFQMQGDLYFDFQLNKKTRFYFDKGLYGGFETFAISKIFPQNGFIKVGQFIPAFGIRTDDHKIWTRSEIGFGERSEDAGIEFGIAPDNFLLNIGVFNGKPGATGFPKKNAKALVYRFEYLNEFNFLNLLVGASIYRLPEFNNDKKLENVFFGFSIKNNFTAIYEIVNSKFDFGNGIQNSKFSNLSLHYQIIQGVDLRYNYETKTFEDKFVRHTFGADFHPISGIELRPIYRINKEPFNEISNDEFQLIFHFYF